MYSTELTWNISNNVTNDLHVSYLRDFWQWVDDGIPPQLGGLGGVLEPGGETATPQAPFTVENQATRTRYWNGQDKSVRDDITVLHNNHLLQLGGLYQRNYLQHQRNDNGGTIQDSPFPVYLETSAGSSAINYTTGVPQACGANGAPPQTNCFGSGTSTSSYEKFYDEALGIISQTQDLYPRTGNNLTVESLGTPALEQSIVPTYNLYFTDTWHIKPTFTLTWGLGYQIEMPPYEINGTQIMMVDQNDVPDNHATILIRDLQVRDTRTNLQSSDWLRFREKRCWGSSRWRREISV